MSGNGRVEPGREEKLKAYFANQWDCIAVRLIKAITEDDREDVETLLAQGTRLEERIEGDTPLTRAVILNRIKTVKLLLKYGADIDLPDDRGRTPLMLAARHGFEKTLRLLINRNADPEKKTPRGRTALIEAAEGGHAGCVKLLIRHGARIDAQETGWLLNGETALMKATYEGFDRVVDLLIKAKADVNRHAEFNGLTAAGLAAKKGRLAVLKRLTAHKADPDAEDDSGRTPLMEASENGRLDLVKYLLRKRARVNTAERIFHRTALIMAVRNGHPEIAAYLLAKRADPELADIDGNTALHWAIKIGSSESVAVLLRKKADPERKNSKGLNAFQLVEKLHNQEQRDVMAAVLARWPNKKIPAI